MNLVGKTFRYLIGGYGDVIFKVTYGPIIAADGTNREFVLADAVGRIKNRRGRAPWRLPSTKGPFFLPLKFLT